VKWNETANTLISTTTSPAHSAAKENRQQRDPVQQICAGSPGHQQCQSLQFDLADGHTTIDLRFTADASGKTFVLAASARDDLGHFAPFVNAGSIVVT
jgi:hypothetical protein